MNIFIDKFIIFIITLVLYLPNSNRVYMVVPILIVVFLSAIFSYLENENITIAIFAFYIFSCFFIPYLSLFIPLICYDAVFLKNKWIWLLSFLPLINSSNYTIHITKWLIASFILISYIFKYRTVSIQKFEKEYRKLRDTTKEISIQLENRIKNF